MPYDYYALQEQKLRDIFRKLEQAEVELAEAKRQGNKKAREETRNRIEQFAREAAKIEPHLAYLWYKARGSELDNLIRDAWQRSLTLSDIPQAFHFTPGLSAIAHMPPLSFMLHVPFRLKKPYLSKDERDFYLLDNPLRKEKVFQRPMVAATSWKGALRAALWQLGYKADHDVTIRLLGNPRESEEGQAGRLYFYPTFFDKIGFDVINPHSRETGVGERGPIPMECVPPETSGKLVLLYVPFAPVGQGGNEKRDKVAQDLEVLAEGVRAMLTRYGFGAKTSSGFGVVEEQLAEVGRLALRMELDGASALSAALPEPAQEPGLPRYLEAPGRLIEDLRQPDGSLKSEAEYRALLKSRGQKYTKNAQQLYEKGKGWWEQEGRRLAEGSSQEPKPKPEPARPEAPVVSEYTFGTLSEMVDLARQVAAQLREGGEA
jgi:CRISPR-associated protein Cmr2